MIRFKNVSKSYDKEKQIINNLNLEIRKGEFVFLTGETGAGKSTILKMIYKAESPTSGDILVLGENTKNKKTKLLRRKIGVVFQDFELLLNKTVYENVSYPLYCLGINPVEVKNRTLKILEKINLSEFENKKPSELSGGQQQKVVIARAIINEPEILVCDEPTGNLDPKTAMMIVNYLNYLNKQGKTIIMSTHNEEIVKEFKHRVVNIEKGRVKYDISVEDRIANPNLIFLDKLGLKNEVIKDAKNYSKRG